MNVLSISVSKSKQILKEQKQEVTIDISKRKSGFKFSEALMESTDDSCDAFYFTDITNSDRKIKIYVFEEIYNETKEFNKGDKENVDGIGEQDDNSRRYSYLILDNGPGTLVDTVFDFGKEKTKRFRNLNALNSLNGLFHYGMSSHLNVGTRLYFYSRTKESGWWMNCLEGSDISNKIFTYQAKLHPEITVGDKELNLDDPEFNVRTVVHVQGVRKSEVEADGVPGIVNSLLKQFGITYSDYLEMGTNIFINDEKVEAIDPFLRKELYVEYGIGSKLIDRIEITLKDILKMEDSYVKESIKRKYRAFFESDDAFLSQKIIINMYHLNAAFLIASVKSKVNRDLPGCMLPSIEDSGFYIKRNHRYIGRAAKILGVDHPSLNYLRFEMAFSPIFDDFLGIQVNKNRYDLKHSLASLIKDRINEKVNTTLSSYTKNYRSKAKPKKEPKLNAPLVSRLKSKSEEANYYEVEIENNIAKARSIGTQIDLIPVKDAVAELNKQNGYISQFITNIVDGNKLSGAETKSAEKLISNIENVVKDASQKLAQLKSIISSKTKLLIEPSNELVNRVNNAKSKNRRLIKSNFLTQEKPFTGTLLEPLNEVQTYGVLYMFLNLFPDKFDFILLDYNESKGIDCVAKIKKGSLYNALNMKVRFESKWNSEWTEFSNNNEGAYSYVELKYKLGEKDNLGHSMVLVSHLICWDFEEEGYTNFDADDGRYTLTEDKDYLVHHDGIKKIKVICLREKVEELLLEDFYNSSDDLRDYISMTEKQQLF
ncbi:hypothetical protein N5C46_10475 [Rossellomorea vietnamensis]|uniref:Uncharacterized protein n=1 Tax=Rossellomorea vietnamensis TaxID=218284 RepID=A0ACD4CCP2_9BACI|nr:hypothetical protein [Rossellomorea vietnamensis]UXH46440.1 hypothetical protein N5C46_10475 [Rossellomorea vietnamensis]